MKKKALVFVLITVGFGFLSSAFAQAQEKQLETAECSEFYKFNSVKTAISPELLSGVAGGEMKFTVDVMNESPFPVINGKVLVKIFKDQENEDLAKKNGHLLIDQFVAQENINLDKGTATQFGFLWPIPARAPEGKYRAFVYLQDGNGFDLSGVLAGENLEGSGVDFEIRSEIKKITGIDKNGIKVNGKEFLFSGKPLKFDEGENVKVSAPIANNSNKPEEIKVTFRLFNRDGFPLRGKIDTKQETVKLAAGETRMVSYEFSHSKYPAYILEIKSEWKGFATFADMQFLRRGPAWTKLNFLGLDSFPLAAGQAAKIFACVQDSKAENRTLKIELTGTDGAVLGNYSYSGGITSGSLGFKGNFAPDKNTRRVVLKATLLNENGRALDSTEISFDCEKFKNCPSTPIENRKEKGFVDLIYILIATGIVVIAGVILLFLKKKNPPAPPNDENQPSGGSEGGSETMGNVSRYSASTADSSPGGTVSDIVKFSFAPLIILLFAGVLFAGAQVKTLYHSFPGPFETFRTQFGDALFEGLGITYDMRYAARAVNLDTGALLSEGTTIPFGTKVKFQALLVQAGVEGRWVNDGDLYNDFIPTQSGVYLNKFLNDQDFLTDNDMTATCISGDYIGHTSGIAIEEHDYMAPAYSWPEVSWDFSGTDAGVLDCADSGLFSKDCTVTGGGNIAAKVVFDGGVNAEGERQPIKLYHHLNTWDATGRCVVPDTAEGFPTHRIYEIPPQEITFLFTASVETPAGNQPPGETVVLDPPVITGPTTGQLDSEQAFTGQFEFLSNYTGGTDKLRYILDWDNDGDVDFGTDFNNPSVPGSASYSWITEGEKTFSARAEDENGLLSDWSSFTITILASSNNPDACVEAENWTTCSVTCGGGTQDLIRTNTDCAATVVDTRTCNTQACGTTIIEVPPGG